MVDRLVRLQGFKSSDNSSSSSSSSSRSSNNNTLSGQLNARFEVTTAAMT